jgi:hypothetical protein
MLRHRDGRTFAGSQTAYLDKIEGHPGNRIYIPVRFAELPKTFAVVDTGAPWCVLSKEQAEVIDPHYRQESIEERNLIIRDHQVDGVLVRWPITLCAEEGVDIKIESTVFIPDDDVQIPNFIGLDGLLNRINFAVDPQNCQFFFGLISHYLS